MSRRPVQQRAEADRLLLAGVEAAAVAEQLGLPARTVRRWAAALAPEVRRAPPAQSSQSRPARRPALAVVRSDGAPVAIPQPPEEPTEPASLVWPSPPLVRPGVALPGPDDHDGWEALVAAAIGAGWSDTVRQQLAVARGDAGAIDGYCSRVLARRAARNREPSETQLAEQLMLVEYSYATAMRHGDISGATRLLAQRARLLGLDRVQIGVEHSGRVGVEHGLSPDELLERRRATLERLRELGAGEGLDS